jgi:hypothetical protein
VLWNGSITAVPQSGTRVMSESLITFQPAIDLVVSGALDANVVSLTSSLGEVNGAGTITADVLDASADTGIDLTGSNDITHLGQVHTNSGTIFINR